MRVTLRGFVVLFSSLLILILSIYALSIYLFTLSISLLLILLWSRSYVARLSREIDRISVKRVIERNRVSENSEVEVRIDVENLSREFFPRIFIRDNTPRNVIVTRGSEKTEISLSSKRSIEYIYYVKTPRIGRFDFEGIELTITDPLALFSEHRYISYYSHITSIPLRARIEFFEKIRSIFPGIVFRGRTLGGLYDLWGFREYVPGDDVRRIYWKGFARTNKLLVREDLGETRPRALVALGLTTSSWVIGDPPNTYAESLLRLFRSLVEHLLDSYASVDLLICEYDRVRIFRELTPSLRERLYAVFDEISFEGGCASIGIMLMSLSRTDLLSYDIVIIPATPIDITTSSPAEVSRILREFGVRIIFVSPRRDYERDVGSGLVRSISERLSSVGSVFIVSEESFERIGLGE